MNNTTQGQSTRKCEIIQRSPKNNTQTPKPVFSWTYKDFPMLSTTVTNQKVFPTPSKDIEIQEESKVEIKESNFEVGYYVRQGRANEDRYTIADIGDWKYLAVFDGHAKPAGSPEDISDDHTVLFLQDNLHLLLEKKFKAIIDPSDDEISRLVIETFLEVDKYLFDNYELSCGGSCATIVLITNTKIFHINLGDSRSIVFTISPDGSCDIVTETKDCTPGRKDERERVVSVGGYVTCTGCWRVNGIIAVSRAFGDFSEKYVEGRYSPYAAVTVIPEIVVTDKQQGQYIVLGCDGLIDGFEKDSQSLVDKIGEQILLSKSLREICENITLFARPKTSDDITMILASL